MGHIAYYRVSTKKQGKSGLGLESQQAIVKHYYPELIAEYTEIESGTNGGRPEMAAAIDACNAGEHRLVVAKVDRLSRNTEIP